MFHICTVTNKNISSHNQIQLWEQKYLVLQLLKRAYFERQTGALDPFL